MHLSFDSLDELSAFMAFAGYGPLDLSAVRKSESAQTLALKIAGMPEPALCANPEFGQGLEDAPAAAPAATPAKRTRRTKAEIEADRARAEAAMAAPLEAEAPEAGDPAAAALAALAGAADDKPPYVDMATYAAQHSARLAETVTPKDFLTTCQAFIAKHQLPAYMELLTTVGIAPTAVASCTAEQRGNILARMEWHDTEFAPVK